MKKLIHCFISLVFLLLTLNCQIIQAQKIQTRNLVDYDDGGKFDFNWGIGQKAHETMKPKLREFLWTHWSQKKLGRIVAIFYTIEGDPTTSTFYVEPDKNGRWIIAEDWKRSCCVLYLLEKKKRKFTTETGKEIYEIIDRIENTKDENVSLRDVPKGVPIKENRKANLYLLRLRRSGEENNITSFEGFIV